MCHVLIIEDEALAALDIRDALRSSGATSFDIAASEREAIASARARRPGVITSDVMLEQGFGHRAVHVIHDELGQIPVIFITATPDQCDDCSAYRVIEKPFNEAELTQAFRDVAPL
jgi:two-component system, response regulator PdtaR